MHRTVDSPVSTVSSFSAITQATVPCKVRWEGREYRVREIGFSHTYRRGRAIVHVFEVNVGTLDMRLELDGETLRWTLKAVSDGLAD